MSNADMPNETEGGIRTDIRAEDVALLQQFEPIVKFTKGERLFPMGVDRYVNECSLWRQAPNEAPELLVPEGELTLEKLAAVQIDQDEHFEATYFLKFIEPLNVAEIARMQLEQAVRKQNPMNIFHPGRGRLARVGYGSRLVDVLFSLTLFARGRLRGDTALAAETTYKSMMDDDEHYLYYGRVVREGGWIALQYWFFYAYNNWRTRFFGVNDHEADWEQVIVYCYEDDDGEVKPEWVAYASHDYMGDDLRRRWDDPEIDKQGDHPIVYAAAGSHASYFNAGEYLTEIELPFLRPLVNLADRFEKARHDALEQYQGVQFQGEEGSSDFNLFRIPFVDYARGDGYAIGPGQKREWALPQVIEPAPGWVRHYRGLWGLFARDPLSGEDAPAGPMYNRDGTVRKAWYDPIGWAGLDKVSPPSRALEEVFARRSDLSSRINKARDTIETKDKELKRLGIGMEAMRGQPHLKEVFQNRALAIDDLTEEIDALRADVTRDEALLDALNHHEARLKQGKRGPMRAHIKKAHDPIDDAETLRLGRVAEFWSASSIGLTLIAFVLLAIFEPGSLWIGMGVLLALFVFFEALFRQKLSRLVSSITVVLAIVSAVLLLIDFFQPVIVVSVAVLGSYVLWENLRELVRK